MNLQITAERAAPSSQAGFTLVQLAAAAAVIAVLLLFTAPLWSHGTALVATAAKSKIDIGERTSVAVVAYEKPRWSLTSRPVPGGTVTLSFANGIQIMPGAQTQATATTNQRGETIFTAVGAAAGQWTGTASFNGDEATVAIEVTGETFTGTYEDDSSLELEDE